MISNEQMEKLWWKYRNEGVAKNISMQAFCSMHNVPYNAFEKYLKLRRHFSDVHHVTVTDLPVENDLTTEEGPRAVISQASADAPVADDIIPAASPAAAGKERVRIMIHIRMGNGMEVSKKNMDYQELHELIGKLEALC